MKIESILNQPGTDKHWTNTRVIGFRVKNSEILKEKESWEVCSPNLMEDLAIQFLKSKGYEVTK